MVWQAIQKTSVSPLMDRRVIAGRRRYRVFDKWPAQVFQPRGESGARRGSMSADRAIGRSEQIIGPACEEESELSSYAAILIQSSRIDALGDSRSEDCPSGPIGRRWGWNLWGSISRPTRGTYVFRSFEAINLTKCPEYCLWKGCSREAAVVAARSSEQRI